jgi:hypothetical protein
VLNTTEHHNLYYKWNEFDMSFFIRCQELNDALPRWLYHGSYVHQSLKRIDSAESVMRDAKYHR